MREGQWIFHWLGPGFVEELARRAGREREQLAALPSYRLAALALKAVAPEVALAGEDGPSTLLDLGGDGARRSPFWSELLRSFNTGGYYPDAPPSDYCQPTEAHHRTLGAALAFLGERAPLTHASIARWIPRILVTRGAPVNGSSPRFFGCVLLPADLFAAAPGRFAAELVHEVAHQELFVLNAYDRLVAPAGDDVVRFSAFAGVRRPTMGRLHAAHALFRMIQLSRQTGEGAFLNRGRLWRTTRGFRQGELTSLGRTIVDEVYKLA